MTSPPTFEPNMDRPVADQPAAPPAFFHKPALFWWMLLLGVAMRLATLNQPLLANSNLRQTQTAVITQSIFDQGSPALDGLVNWQGDAEARLRLELPLYNWLVAGLYAVVGHLDACGKLVSVGLWAASFVLLQSLWRRLLEKEEIFWANFLFLFAPLSLYFGQVFQPEMLIQCVSFAILVLLWKYVETGALRHFLALAATGLLGMLLKTPEVMHLYLVMAVMLFRRHGRALWRQPRYWLALAVTAGVMRLWGLGIDRTNWAHFPEWTSAKVLHEMVGPWFEHLRPLGYLRLFVYLSLFVAALGGLVWIAWGLAALWQRRRTPFALAWLGALVFSYVFWAGVTSRAHSYYNLPALGPACLLFGLGCVRWLETAWARRHLVAARGLILAFVLAGAAGPCAFLYRQDPVLHDACAWLRQNTAPADLVLVRINHRTDTSRYLHNSTVSYYANRRIWCWVAELPEDQRKRALLTSKWALVTQPAIEVGLIEKLRRYIKVTTPLEEDMRWLETAGFTKHYEGNGFIIYKHR